MKFPSIVICKATEVVDKVQQQAKTGLPFAAVLSFEHPGAESAERGRAPRLGEVLGAPWDKRQLIQTMWDVEQPRLNAPTIEQVRAVIQHFDHYAPANNHAPSLAHCRQGKARSTGIVLALLRHRAGAGTEADCLDQLLQIAPKAAPNLLIVQHADVIFGCHGKLVDVVTQHPEITARRMAAEASRAAQIASGRFVDFEKIGGEAAPNQPAHRPNPKPTTPIR